MSDGMMMELVISTPTVTPFCRPFNPDFLMHIEGLIQSPVFSECNSTMVNGFLR